MLPFDFIACLPPYYKVILKSSRCYENNTTPIARKGCSFQPVTVKEDYKTLKGGEVASPQMESNQVKLTQDYRLYKDKQLSIVTEFIGKASKQIPFQ